MYKKEFIERLKHKPLIEVFDVDAKRRFDCPMCHHKLGMALYNKKGKWSGKCFHCDAHFADLLDAAAKINNLDYKNDYREVVRAAADMADMPVEEDVPPPSPHLHSKKKEAPPQPSPKWGGSDDDTASFVMQQLKESGLTRSDVLVRAREKDSQAEVEVYAFRKGGINHLGEVNSDDDEMLIYYYDLNGRQATYRRRGTSVPKPYVRIRWSNPDLHLNTEGRPIKYQTPPGAQCLFYFPQRIRDKYSHGEVVETLIIQEGEKKAEKACKHGIMSIGIQGIYNIGNSQTGLIQDLQYLVKRCSIKNIVLLMDSDWNHLSQHLQKGDAADQRPKSFANAVIKFKQYVGTLHNCNLSVDIFFGHINENENGDKGIDDLLVHTLIGKEQLLKEDIERTMKTHDGRGTYVDIHKVSTLSDFKIMEFWHLNNAEAFFCDHREQLTALEVFKLGKIRYIVKDGKLSTLTKYESDDEFWFIKTNDKGKETVAVSQVKVLDFVEANGYRRIKTKDCDTDKYKFMHIDGSVIGIVGASDIRDFVYSYVRQATKEPRIHSFFADKLGQILATDRLERLALFSDDYDSFEIDLQRFYFGNCCVKATPASVCIDDAYPPVWDDKIIAKSFRLVPIIKSIKPDASGGFRFVFSDDAADCEFLQFIKHTSDFWNTHDCQSTQFNDVEFSQHLVNKITAIGYLLTDYKYQSELKAVVAMDGQNGEVARSNGRTGKSLVGAALSKMLAQAPVDGRNTPNNDEYIYTNVTPRTRNIFFDDAQMNFDFERFFFAITGDLVVNPKFGSRFVLKNEVSPKFYITTNHAINADSRSALERIIFMSFSNWYNDDHRPIDDFGHQFFADWDEEQWNLFYNFMIECCHYYLRSMSEQWYRVGQGAVPPPMEDITKRRLKQQMSEDFLQWADAYFDPDAGNLNARINRKDMQRAFAEECPKASAMMTSAKFKVRLCKYCEYMGYHLNPQRPNEKGIAFSDFVRANPDASFIGTADKSCGMEFFTIATREI